MVAGLGQLGVDFFFVLSGFIIFAAHRDDIGRPERVRDYALKRAIRLLPLLWTVVVGWGLLRLIMGAPVVPIEFARSILLWPSTGPTMPVVVWTLRHELLFYLAFAVLMAWPAGGTALFAIWGAASLLQAMWALDGQAIGGAWSLILSGYTIDFLLGAGVAWLHRANRLPRGLWVMPAAVLALTAAWWLSRLLGLGQHAMLDYTGPGAAFGTMLLGLGFAAVLVGLLALEHHRLAPAWAVSLGAASYAIYLVHGPVNSAAQRIAAWLPAPVLAVGGGHLLLTVAGVAVGVGFHQWFERPVTRALRRRWLGQTRPAETAAR